MVTWTIPWLKYIILTDVFVGSPFGTFASNKQELPVTNLLCEILKWHANEKFIPLKN